MQIKNPSTNGYKVYYSDPKITAKAGFGKVAHLPCIFDARPSYHRLASRYLIDRGLGIWRPPSDSRLPRGACPSDQTMRNYAHWLANFLEWADAYEVDLPTCHDVMQMLTRYQHAMRTGTWSCAGAPLSRVTILLRTQQAYDFLSWMADCRLRSSLATPSPTVPARHKEERRTSGQVSLEHHRTPAHNKRHLRLPTDTDLRQWLDQVYARFGDTYGLMCESVLLTAMRREEVACWRVDSLPECRDAWHLNHAPTPSAQQVLVTIRYGTKGPCYGYDHGDKIGPERSIWIPLALAERLHDFRRRGRNSALKRWVSRASDQLGQQQQIRDAVHLFLDPSTGQRITAKALYRAWTGVPLPFDGWSPHRGRDWWACSILWQELQRHEQLIGHGLDVASALLESSAMSVIRLYIQPQLGHAHDSTTMIYLQWLIDRLGHDLSIRYDLAFNSVPGP
ncbi:MULTISPECIES: site-specific integrase [Burkholderia cepacia complex]|uniref:Site-specific integrase n=1 Tax=Burkholderia cenocepacia TaxID=95486 RepID=A0ABD4UJK5_9BURK|nr:MULTISPECIES: site-specific integrase [Burkholderia cepacia complex]MCW3698188.1 site-specific integrase [Burkholderia cenocepacia]MCW3706041.1 site-specific integrase [Burkholderia cenocepacia]MCW3714282.1 site-specific integrase [Burkholderia cenocepacia]MCW3722348.1 site-specific integrase [Burkholderia cenocepacia]MCW3730514.1 site-specific integrase [Burkholderia cenocepacia]